MYLLNENDLLTLRIYLSERGWLFEKEQIQMVEKPGEGNMNYVLRVQTNLRSFILKQSRAYVEKYPQIAAPEKRVVTESIFYEKVATVPEIQQRMPKILGIDKENNLLVLEDLGKSSDYSFLYELEKRISAVELSALVGYLNDLHGLFSKKTSDEELMNLEMRTLNFEHIFKYPFQIDNGFDLNLVQDGLQELALEVKLNVKLLEKIEKLGTVYLENGLHLLHGDFYPGSWLHTSAGIKIIDPEFCFYGFREFDLGVFIAHLYLTHHDYDLIERVKNEYTEYALLDTSLLSGFVGIEILRRLIGLAQLPLQMKLEQKKVLLDFAQDLILKN